MSVALQNRMNAILKSTSAASAELDNAYERANEKVVIEPHEIVKKELRESIGDLHPMVKAKIEEELKNMNYKRKTRAECGDIIVKSIDDELKKI